MLAVFPFFVPELLIGFNYRLTATQLSSGASPVIAAICTESLYALLQLVRCVSVGVALSLLLPRSAVTRESLYSWDLLQTVQLKHDVQASGLRVHHSLARLVGQMTVGEFECVGAVGHHDFGKKAVLLEIVEKALHVRLIVAAHQGERDGKIAQRIGGQQ